MRTWTFTVNGTPAPQGSKRHIGNGIMLESSKRVKPWREDIRQTILNTTEGDGPSDKPMAVDVRFYLARPKSHYCTGKNAHLIRDAAPLYPVGRPDLDKLVRAVLDAIGSTGTVWRDDSQAFEIHAVKRYADPKFGLHPGARINICEVPT